MLWMLVRQCDVADYTQSELIAPRGIRHCVRFYQIFDYCVLLLPAIMRVYRSGSIQQNTATNNDVKVVGCRNIRKWMHFLLSFANC